MWLYYFQFQFQFRWHLDLLPLGAEHPAWMVKGARVQSGTV